MSKYTWSETDDRRGQPEDTGKAPTGDFNDGVCVSSARGSESVPVVSDGAGMEDPARPGKADTDRQGQRDGKEAIDEGYVVKSRLRGNKPTRGTVREPDYSKTVLAEAA